MEIAKVFPNLLGRVTHMYFLDSLRKEALHSLMSKDLSMKISLSLYPANFSLLLFRYKDI